MHEIEWLQTPEHKPLYEAITLTLPDPEDASFISSDEELLKYFYDIHFDHPEQIQWVAPVLAAMPRDSVENFVSGLRHYPSAMWVEVAATIMEREDTTITMALAMFLDLGTYRYQPNPEMLYQHVELRAHVAQADKLAKAINSGRFPHRKSHKWTSWSGSRRGLKILLKSAFQASEDGLDPDIIAPAIAEIRGGGEPIKVGGVPLTPRDLLKATSDDHVPSTRRERTIFGFLSNLFTNR